MKRNALYIKRFERFVLPLECLGKHPILIYVIVRTYYICLKFSFVAASLMLDDLNEEYRFVPIKMETTGLIMNDRDFSHLTSTSIKTSTFSSLLYPTIKFTYFKIRKYT